MTMKVYGSRISYYTGKLECYLRYKGIAYQPLPLPYDRAEMLKQKVGAVQMPIVDDDGTWMSDTTPILEHLEIRYPQTRSSLATRSSPLWRFLSRITRMNGCGVQPCTIAGGIAKIATSPQAS